MSQVPWFIGGGAEHPAEVARLLAYNATSGSEGIAGPNHLKVLEQSIPGPGVRIIGGSCTILNRSAGGSYQSYLDRIPNMETLSIAPTTSGSGRTDLIVRVIQDPQYPPWSTPADVVNGPYSFYRVIQGVPSATKTFKELNEGYSAIALAKITIPASTGTITQNMITDLRDIAVPRRLQRIVDLPLYAPPSLIDNINITKRLAETMIDVPDWATRVNIGVTAAGIKQGSGSFNGWLYIGFDTDPLAAPRRDVVIDDNVQTQYTRKTYAAGGEYSVASSLRGRSCYLQLKGKKQSGAGNLTLDSGTTVFAVVEFMEHKE